MGRGGIGFDNGGRMGHWMGGMLMMGQGLPLAGQQERREGVGNKNFS